MTLAGHVRMIAFFVTLFALLAAIVYVAVAAHPHTSRPSQPPQQPAVRVINA